MEFALVKVKLQDEAQVPMIRDMTDVLPYHSIPQPPQPDRSGRILAVGIILTICGVMTSCILAIAPLALLAPQPPGEPGVEKSQIVGAMLIYLVLSIILLTLGIGTFMKRRWIRPLTIILSTHWMIGGVFTVFAMLLMYPVLLASMTAPAGGVSLPPGTTSAILIVIILMIGVIGIALPALLIWLLKSEECRITLEWFDNKARWTDHCPLKILGLAITLCVAGLLFASSIPYAMVPGVIVHITGAPAVVLIMIFSALLLLAGYWVYRLKMTGWWIGFGVIVVFAVLASLTPVFVSPVEYYRSFGMTPDQLAIYKTHEDSLRWLFIAMSLLFGISFAIYMLRLKPVMEQAIREQSARSSTR
ncbi:MAG: hypothetical protein H7144_14980 [Burkholderiales bacterium]|nr:hypothetical protein [Phycisphaerae bacterium]